MNVLVTGGAGFIGSHLADRLVRTGHEVVVVDNESTGRRDNIACAVRYLEGDVSNPADLESAFAIGLDAVCHIAGQVSLVRSFSDPTTDLRTNIAGTLNILQACLKYRVPRLVYASSMAVYGRSEVLPTPERSPCEPSSYYGITKYAAERYVHTTAERLDLDFDFHVTSLRMYNVYGPRQALDNPYQGVLGIFLGNLLRGEPITIFGDGDQTRDFVFIDDVVEAWVAALRNPASHGAVLNIGSGHRLGIKQLAHCVLQAFGRAEDENVIVHASARSGEQRHVAADISRAAALLGWKPMVSLTEGLDETIHWARQRWSLSPCGHR
jgi:UDP-glucose 4-epimerase